MIEWEDHHFFEKLFLALLLPFGAWLLLLFYHFRFPSFHLLFQLMPYLVTVFLCHRYLRRHRLYWDERFILKKYLPWPRLIAAACFLIVVTYFTWFQDVSVMIDSGMGKRAIYINNARSRGFGLIIPFVISGYVLPFLLFPHVVAEMMSLKSERMAMYIAHSLILACCLTWIAFYVL